MAEEKPEEKKEEKKEEKPAEKTPDEKIEKAATEEKGGTPAPVQDKGGSPLKEAKEVLEKITEQNKITVENLKKQEELQAEAMISGRTPAGQGSLSEEEQKDADARKLIEGSGFEDRIFPKKK